MDIMTFLTGIDGASTVVHIVLNLALTQLAKNKINIDSKWKQAISWLISISIGLVYNYFGIGIFAGVAWYVAIVFGFIVGLVANGIFDIKTIKETLEVLSKQSDNQTK